MNFIKYVTILKVVRISEYDSVAEWFMRWSLKPK